MTTFRKALSVLTSLSMPSGLLALRRPSVRNTRNREMGAGLVETSISVGLVGTMALSSVVLFGGELNSQFSHRIIPVVAGGSVGQEDQSNVAGLLGESANPQGDSPALNDTFNDTMYYWDVPSFIEPSYEHTYSPEPVYEDDYSSVAGSISPPAPEYISEDWPEYLSEDWFQRLREGDGSFFADNSFVAGGISPASDPAHPDYIGPLRFGGGDEASESDTWTWEQQYESDQRLREEALMHELADAANREAALMNELADAANAGFE